MCETLESEADALERAVFALRMMEEGLDLARVRRLWPVLAGRIPHWRETLDFNVSHGLLRRKGDSTYAPTARGAEVCDGIVAGLV